MLRGVFARRSAAAKLRKCRVSVAPPDALMCYDAGKWEVDKVDPMLVRIEELKKLKREKAELAEEEDFVTQTRCLPSSIEELESRATAFFRSVFYLGARETRGALYDLMLLLYVGELCDKQQRQFTPDSDAVLVSLAQHVRNGSVTYAYAWIHSVSSARDQVRSFARSDYFLGPVEASRDEREALDFKDLTVDEVALLIHALHQPGSLLAKLMTPDPLLTHHENLHTAVEHARLFLLKSELPIRFALDITYRDLASHVLNCEFSDCRIKGAATGTLMEAVLHSAEDRFSSTWFPFPSSVEADLRGRTIRQHHAASKDPSRRVQHLDPADCPVEAHPLVKRVMKQRMPFTVGDPCNEYRDWKTLTMQYDGVAGTMEESEYWIYGEWMHESPELRALFMRT